MAALGELILKLPRFQLSFLYDWASYQGSDKERAFVEMSFHIKLKGLHMFVVALLH